MATHKQVPRTPDVPGQEVTLRALPPSPPAEDLTPAIPVVFVPCPDRFPSGIEERHEKVKLRLKLPFLGGIEVDLDRIFRRGV
jgi:hypothetical protein